MPRGQSLGLVRKRRLDQVEPPLGGRVDRGLVDGVERALRKRRERAHGLDLIPEELDPECLLIHGGRLDLHDIAAGAEFSTAKLDVVPLVKHVHQLCSGVHIHAEGEAYDHAAFKPWRVQALAFKAIRMLFPDYEIWREFPYEYAFGKLPIDDINGSPLLREWVDDPAAEPADLDAITVPDEQAWHEKRRPYLIY